MPWRGPGQPGEFPTLGYIAGDWIEAHVVIPDGAQRGTPYLLTDEMWRHLIWCYRLRPNAMPHPVYPRPNDGRLYRGSQLRRVQKWGKDPLGAAKSIFHALGPAQFDGWDSSGEPVGRPIPTPWVQILATSEDQTDNMFRPLYRMLGEGPLADTPGLDIGETRIKLPNGDGWIEPVTASARSRLGNPITHGAITEPHLMTESSGDLATVRAMKRGLTGMGGDWGEYTNAWDPSEHSAAQATAEAARPDVYLDHSPAADRPAVDLLDDLAVRERIVIAYGDSARSAGGWVNEDDVYADVIAADTGEGEARRYFLDEITEGDRVAVSAVRWDALARLGAALVPGDAIAIGFDGSRTRDWTALLACRISDCLWVPLALWDPADYGGQVPEADVDRALDDAMAAYVVWHVVGDPYYWQPSMKRWDGKYGNNPAGKPVVIDFPTAGERRMDEAIELQETVIRSGEFGHDGDRRITAHAKATVLKYGKRKPPMPDGSRPPGSDRYKRFAKKRGDGLMVDREVQIDGYVAGTLGTYGRFLAIEEGALSLPVPVTPATANVPDAGDLSDLWRPRERLPI